MRFGSEKPIQQIADSQSLARHPRRPAGVKVVSLVKVLVERRLWIVPRAEVVKLAADFLCPAAGSVGEQGEVGIRLCGLGNHDRVSPKVSLYYKCIVFQLKNMARLPYSL